MKSTIFNCLALLFTFTSALAQDNVDLNLFKNIKARSIGPAGMSGRITSIDAVHSQPEVIYVGTASGGLWRSESGGISWEPLFDDQPVQSIGAVTIQQSNPDVIWAGTGEGNPRNSQSSGAGIYKSIDGGKSWKLMGLKQTKTIHRIIVSPTKPDHVWVAALGSAWGDNSERGVYKTENGGKTWKKVLYVNNQTGCADLVIDPTNPDKLIAAMWQYQRQPWTFNSGGEGSGMYVTYDGGESWKKRTAAHGLPKGNLGRIGLAIAPSNTKIIYALVENEKKYGLYKSANGGFNWHLVSDHNVGNRPFYYADLFVDPANENRIYNLWSYVSLSEDGGRTFKNILDYGAGVHPDHHAFWVHPLNPNYLIEGNDGGLNISHDRGKNWRMVENLPLGQFYHINVDNDLPYHIYGGLQDNGSWCGPAYVWSQGGIRNNHWQELLFGDGFDVVPDLDNSRYGYAMYQGGAVYRYDRETGKNWPVRPADLPDTKLRYNWNAAIADDPFSNTGLYFGSQFLHHSKDNGQTWQILSPDLTTNDPEKQQQHKSGGLTIDATEAENYTTITTIAPSPLDEKMIWVGTDDGRLQLTTTGGESWQDLYSKLSGAPKGGWIPQIVASSHDKNCAFVIVNNYRQNDWHAYAYKTTDGGKKWTRMANNDDVGGYCLSVVQDPVEAKLLFLGTENGLYVSFNGGDDWQQWKHGVPSVSVMDMKIQVRENDLVLGTFGRAVFVIDDISALRSYCNEGEKKFEIYPIPTSYLAAFKAPSGLRFTAQAHFKGQNRSNGAMISFYMDEKIMIKDEKVKVLIADENGDTVRHFEMKVDTGFNRMFWRHQRNGTFGPSHHSRKTDRVPGNGITVAPGKYSISLIYNKQTAKQDLEVKADPRRSFDQEAYAARKVLLAKHDLQKNAVAKAINQMHETQDAIGLANKLMTNPKDSTQSKLKKEGKDIKDSLDKLMELVLLPRDFVGYEESTMRIGKRLGRTQEYITGSFAEPSQMATESYQLEVKEIADFLEQVNAFYEEEIANYIEKIDALNVSPFKEVEKIEIGE